MNDDTVAGIMIGQKDSTGSEILTVYSKVRSTYAVYRTKERVAIQFADDPSIGTLQRKALSPLNPLRGQINGLIDGWRAAESEDYRTSWRIFFWRPRDSHEIRAKAAMFDRRVADTLSMALQGDVDGAELLLAEIKTDLLEERTSIARIDYIAFAGLAALSLVLVALVMTGWLGRNEPEERRLWLACGAGALGALFSTAIAMRSRAILTDLQLRENRADAIARIGIGAVAGVLLVVMVSSKIVSVDIDGGQIEAGTWVVIAFLAFLGGFSERLVPDLLERTAGKGRPAENPLAGATGLPARTKPAADANEKNPLGTAAAPPPFAEPAEPEAGPSDDVDGCVSDVAMSEDEETHDSQLPAAIGGVEEAREKEPAI